MMKRFLTLALTMVVTSMVLPIVSWAQTSPFDGQKYVSETTTWLFNNETISDTQTTGITENNSLYYRSKSTGGGFTFVELQTQEVITFSDGFQVTISKIARTSANNSDGMSEIYAGTSGGKTFSGKTSATSNYAFAAFAFNASVPGTCYAYVKPGTSNKMRISFGEGDGTTLIYADGTTNTEIQEIKLTSTKAGSFFIHGTSDNKTRDIYAIRFVPTETTINSEKTWTFESLAKDHTFSSITHKGDGLYLRGQSSNNRNITINEINSDKAGTLNAGLGTNPTDETEPWSTSNAIPSFAFKTTCSGKVYVSVSKNSSASTDPTLKISSGSKSIKEQKLTTFDKVEVESPVGQAGTFFISGANCDVYSIHFVPETYEKINPTIENLAAANLIYTGSAQNLVTTPSVNGGTITFSTEQNGTYTDVIPQGTDAGNYSVWYKVTGDETHNDIAATLVEGVKINKATYTVDGTATTTAAYGTQVKDITITGLTVKNGSGAEVEGSWAFSAEETATPAVDNTTAYTATFTPSTADTNYETLTTEITPTITSVSYTVEHYQQNIENDEYTKVEGDTQTITTGKAGEQTAAEAKSYEGFTAPETVTQATIAADGSTVVKINYTRNSYTISFNSNGGTNVAAITGKYGSAVTAPADPTRNDYTFAGWDQTIPATMPAENLTITAKWNIQQASNEETNATEQFTVKEDGKVEVASVTPAADASSVSVPGSVGGAEVTSIASGAFTVDNSKDLKSVDLSATQVALTGDVRAEGSPLENIPTDALIYLPSTSSEATGTNVIIHSATTYTEDEAYKNYTCAVFQLSGQDADNKAASVIPLPFKATTAKLNRTFTANKKCTVCLPYAFTATGGTFYTFTGISDGKVQMTAVTSGTTLQANTPYIFEPSGTALADAENVKISIVDAPATTNDAFTFKGTYKHIDWTNDNLGSGTYAFAAEDKDGAQIGQFVKLKAGATTNAYRCYLVYDGTLSDAEVQSARTRGDDLPDVLEVEWIPADSETSISSVEQQKGNSEAIYNLSGQRVGRDYKGLVIKNGKKVYVK